MIKRTTAKNKYKTISIINTGTAKNWKSNLSSLLSSSARGPIVEKVSSSLNAKVDLLIDSGTFPNSDFEFKNSFTTPINNFLEGKGSTSRVVENVGKIITSAANVVSSVETLASNIEKGDTSAAAVFNPWFKNTPAYDPSKLSPPSFSYTFNFALGQYGLWNARDEVVLPILNLIAPTLPKSISSGYITPAFPTTLGLLANIIGEIFSGDASKAANTAFSKLKESYASANNSFTNLLSGESGENLFTSAVATVAETASDTLNFITDTISGIINNSYRNFTYTVKFGEFITFNNMILAGSTFNFSSETDTKGYPISGKCTLTFTGVVPVALNSDLPEGMQPSLKFGV